MQRAVSFRSQTTKFCTKRLTFKAPLKPGFQPQIANSRKIAEGFGLIVGTLLWGTGMWWLLLAMLITIRYFRTGVPFNLGWWGYIFPLGVYAVATLKLGVLLKITVFSIFGTGLVAILAGMWFFVMLLTIYEGWQGRLFFSPCIANVN